MKKVILISVIVLITLSVAGMFFANKVFDIIFTAYVSDLKPEPVKDIRAASTGVPIKAPGGDEPAAQVREEAPKAEKGNIPGNEKNIGTGQSSDKANTLNNETNNYTGGIPNPSIIPKADPKEVEQVKPPNTKAITPQTIAAVEKKVSAADKSRAIQIIMSRLTADDIAKLKALAKGGMTPAKTAQAKAIVKSRITGQDIEELKQLYYKYAE